MKLPKQWRHWCAGQRLKPAYSSRKDWAWLYLRGRGHYWRVNFHGMFQRGDTYADFDRWALCDIKELPLPKTKAEFDAAVKELLCFDSNK